MGFRVPYFSAMAKLLPSLFSCVLLCSLALVSDASAATTRPLDRASAGPVETSGDTTRSVVTGTFDEAPALPSTQKLAGQQRIDATAAAVLEAVRKRMPSTAADEMRSITVSIHFTVDQYGDVKDIRVQHQGEPKLMNTVSVALYELRFIPATKDGVATRVQWSITCPREALDPR